MGRLLAIDYGLKRTGIAVSDPLQIIATPLATVATAELWDYLKNYTSQEAVERFVVGEPKNLDNTPAEIADDVQALVDKLRTLYPNIPVAMVDERYTSKMAQQVVIQSGIGKQRRRNKALLDPISASLILQTYMEQLANKPF